jgi:predicted adenine nucleotide alpha hydrolase (AANH) superfamily ATPase
VKKRNILLHTCCAPCICYVYDLLHPDYSVISFFYNPNISPISEYNTRLDELKKFSDRNGFRIIVGKYDHDRWDVAVRDVAHLGERSERCWRCYGIRLEEAFLSARDNGVDMVATAMSISPHKDAGRINAIGAGLEEKYGIKFMEADFKKDGGFQKSVELSMVNKFYRQNYCGCSYSKKERERK